MEIEFEFVEKQKQKLHLGVVGNTDISTGEHTNDQPSPGSKYHSKSQMFRVSILLSCDS